MKRLKNQPEMQALSADFLFFVKAGIRGIKKRLPAHKDCAAIGRFQKIQAAQQRCFSAAGGSDNGQHLPLFQ